MKSVLLVALFVVIGSCSSLVEEWETWKLAYNKKYVSPDEEVKRYNVWIENKKFIEIHNKKNDKIGYTLEMNKFGDMTTDEFTKVYTGLRMDDKATNHGIISKTYVSKDQDIPSSWDWRSHGYVTGVKTQNQCGGSSEMAIVDAVEGQHFKATHHLVPLSTQQVIDCIAKGGCRGATSIEVYQYIEKYGLEPEASYKPKDSIGCGYNASLVVTKCGGYASVTKGSESELLRICHDNGPITVTIDAGRRSFQLYKNGVYSDTLCSSVTLDHTVLLVGWGNYNGKDYWLLKNSWGPAWGMEGYFMLARNQNNMCGIATRASYPTECT